jgi:hypothetical protein
VPSALSPGEFATFMHTERQKWDRLAKSAHITLE